MRDALRRIIGHHRQLISPKAVGVPQQHKITDVVRQILRIMADHRIIKADDFIRHAHARQAFCAKPAADQPGAATVVHKTIRPRTRRRL